MFAVQSGVFVVLCSTLMGTLHTTTLHGVNRLHAVNKTKINIDCHRGETASGFSDDWGDIYVKYQSENSCWEKLISSGPSLVVVQFIGLFAVGFF